MTKEVYIEAELEVVRFEGEDIITASDEIPSPSPTPIYK